eukprot:3630747-Pyramimonas_sp.AAC.1
MACRGLRPSGHLHPLVSTCAPRSPADGPAEVAQYTRAAQTSQRQASAGGEAGLGRPRCFRGQGARRAQAHPGLPQAEGEGHQEGGLQPS